MVKKGKVARSETFRCYVIDCRNFGLHPSTREKREKDVFKNRIPLRRSFKLKSVHRRIPGYMFMESQDKSICYVIDCRNFGLHPSTREKRKKGVFKNQIPLRRAFRLKSGYHWIDVRGKPLLRKKL